MEKSAQHAISRPDGVGMLATPFHTWISKRTVVQHSTRQDDHRSDGGFWVATTLRKTAAQALSVCLGHLAKGESRDYLAREWQNVSGRR